MGAPWLKGRVVNWGHFNKLSDWTLSLTELVEVSGGRAMNDGHFDRCYAEFIEALSDRVC